MNLIRRSAWVIVMLGGVAGCTGDEGSTPPGPAATPNPSLAPGKPVIPAPAKTDAAKEEGTSKEMPPTPAKSGEGKKSDETKKGEDLPKVEGPKTEGTSKGETAAVKLTPDEIATIKQLPAADQELALKQAVCPVSDEHLGEMGKPEKRTIEGRTVFLCCENCEKELKADPKKYLAKLDAQAGKK
jgi:YHS domain-containing protein